MSKLLTDKIKQQSSNGTSLLWLDWCDYGQNVILNGKEIPWGDSSALVNFLGQGQSLLKLGVASLPLGDYFDWWITQYPAALAEMSGKRRVGFALKKFLANSALRKQLKELVSSAAAATDTPLVLSIPSPRQLLVWANNTANKVSDTQIDNVAADSAYVYLADFLREFSDTQIAGVLIEEADNAGLNSEQLGLYQPIVNIGDAYEWSIGVRAIGSPGAGFAALDMMIGHDCAFEGAVSCPLSESFWNEGGSDAGDFVYGKVPADAVPEKVLEALASLGG